MQGARSVRTCRPPCGPALGPVPTPVPGVTEESPFSASVLLAPAGSAGLVAPLRSKHSTRQGPAKRTFHQAAGCGEPVPRSFWWIPGLETQGLHGDRPS